MKPAAWVGLAVILASLAFGASAFVSNLTPYVTFKEARAAKGTVQVMGKLDKTSLDTNGGGLSFVIVDKDGNRMPVTFKPKSTGNLTSASFKTATEVTAIGTFDGETMQASNLLVKCPSKYQGTDENKSYASG